MKIIQLRSCNVKKLSAVEITPTGDLVVISGKNGAGKSSVLDSIMFALAGGDKLPKMPVRRGAEKAKITLNLGEIVVTRTFTAAGGTTLTIKGKEGVKFASPQTMLDSLTGRLTFDPLEFARAKPAQQAETLRALVGLDFTKADETYNVLYARRAEANRRVKQAEATQATTPKPTGDTPAGIQSVSQIMAEIEKVNLSNWTNQEARVKLQQQQENLERSDRTIQKVKEEIKELEASLHRLNATRSGEMDTMLRQRALVDNLRDIDVSPLRERAAKVEENNAKFHAAQKWEDGQKTLAEARNESEVIQRAMERNQEDKNAAIQAAKYPIEGLSIDTAGVTLNGIPFEQASTAEQLKVSVAMGFALNPKLRVLLIRNGNDLDRDNLKLLAEMATEAKAQVWIERVETDGAVSVVIEDGHVQGVEAEPAKDETEGPPDATEPPKSATKGCPRCGAPMAFGPSGLACTAKCKPITQRPADFSLTTEAPPEE